MTKSADGAPALLELKLLQLFDVLYTTRSVTRAADLLGQSQPTVSIWLAKLRRQLRDPLFVRTPMGMQPTPQADVLISQARDILESLRRLSVWESTFVPATAQRHFRICMTDASHITLLPELLAHVRAVAPEVRLEAAGIDSNTAHALESGEADLALGYIPSLESGIYQQTLFPQNWVCLANASHPRIGKTLTPMHGVFRGYQTLLALYSFMKLAARLRALRAGRPVTSLEDVREGVRLVERAFVLHARYTDLFALNPMVTVMADRLYQQPSFVRTATLEAG